MALVVLTVVPAPAAPIESPLLASCLIGKRRYTKYSGVGQVGGTE